MSDYDSIPAVNKSTLWEMRKSPLHYWHLMHDTPKEDTAAMKFGRAVHAYLLTPDKFDDDYVIAPDVDRRTKEGKAIWAELTESGKEIVSAADAETLEAMAEQMTENKIVRNVIWSRPAGTLYEVPLTWTDPETGVDCKGRIDAMTDDYIFDYKTTTNAATDAFMREAIRYGYDLQAAMYMEAARANGYKPKGFIFIAQEKNAPYLINVLHAGDAFLDRGAWIMRDLLRKYKECRDSDTWPGYGENELILPEWEVIDDE